MAVIPLSHAYGFGNLLMPLLLQGTAIVLRERSCRSNCRPTRGGMARRFHGVPFMFQHFVANPPAAAGRRRCRLLDLAGARLEAETVRGSTRRFGVKIHSFYGTSETGGIAYDRQRRRARGAECRHADAGGTVDAACRTRERRRTAAASTSRSAGGRAVMSANRRAARLATVVS